MIALGDHAEGLILPVRAQPGARRAGVRGEKNGALDAEFTLSIYFQDDGGTPKP